MIKQVRRGFQRDKRSLCSGFDNVNSCDLNWYSRSKLLSRHPPCHNHDDNGDGYGRQDARRYIGVHDEPTSDVGISSMMSVVVVVMTSIMSVVIVVMTSILSVVFFCGDDIKYVCRCYGDTLFLRPLPM